LWLKFIEDIRKHELDVEIFDPLVTLHNTSELLTATMDPVIREVFAAIANETNTAVELAHHPARRPMAKRNTRQPTPAAHQASSTPSG
jgi:RecA-family ATPase